MTDEQIVNALESCILCECEECPHDEETACKEQLNQEVLDLLNRQKAEIERLKREAVIDANEIKCTRIHRDRARAEAIKEFAERLKAKADTECFYEDDETYTRCVVDTDKIDKIANEMVGAK